MEKIIKKIEKWIKSTHSQKETDLFLKSILKDLKTEEKGRKARWKGMLTLHEIGKAMKKNK